MNSTIAQRVNKTWLALTVALVTGLITYKKLSCRRETARRFVSLNILRSHSRSLKVIRNDTTAQGVCKSVFQWHYMSVCRTVSEIFSIKEWRDLETVSSRHSRSLKIEPCDRSYTTFYCSAIVSIAYVVLFSSYLTLNNHDLKRSLKIIRTGTIESFGAVSYSPSTVTMAVSLTVYEIFSVKE